MSQQGTRIGPYALQVQVGRSAGCSVWHAVRADGKSRGPDRVAVRLLDDPGDQQAQARLELEYQRLKTMDGVGAPLPVAHYAGFGALVMEQKQGSSLRALLDASMAATLELDTATSLEIALGVARTLRHGHQLPEGVVHGRLAPADVLLGRDSSVTLMGWGGWSPQAWTSGVAPEVMRGQAPSAFSDMYALGALLCTMLEPRLTQAQGLHDAVHRIERGWPAAGRLLQNLLASDPAGRYPDLGPVIHELLSLARHHGGVARVAELAERCSTFRRGGGGAMASLNATQGPVAPVVPPRDLPPVVPPPVIPPPQVEPSLPPGPSPVHTPEPVPAAVLAPAPSTRDVEPLPVPPEPVARPAADPTPPPVEPAPAQPEAPPEEIEKTEPLERPPEPAPELSPPKPSDEHDEPAVFEDDGASMQLMERVALGLVGLLGLMLLAWLGRSCLGG
jgi:hypothetical protein